MGWGAKPVRGEPQMFYLPRKCDEKESSGRQRARPVVNSNLRLLGFQSRLAFCIEVPGQPLGIKAADGGAITALV